MKTSSKTNQTSLEIHEPTEEENAAALESFFASMRSMKTEREEAVQAARPALVRLCEAMRERTGQGFKLRGLLYSLYNGNPASLVELVTLDWQLHKDVCAVALAFGAEDFFYDEIKAAVTAVGLWSWFVALKDEEEAA